MAEGRAKVVSADVSGKRSHRLHSSVSSSSSTVVAPVARSNERFPVTFRSFHGRSLTFDCRPSDLLYSLANFAFAEEVQEMRPLLRLCYTRQGQKRTIASLVDPVKLDVSTVAEFTSQFSDDFSFSVVAILLVHSEVGLPPLPSSSLPAGH